MDNYPIGAKDDVRAPYNEPLDVKHKRFVSVTLSFYHTVEGHPEMSKKEIKEAVENYIKSKEFSSVPFDIDELIVLND